MTQVFTHASELITGRGIRVKGGRHPDFNDLDRIVDGAMVFEDRKKILWVGPTKDLPKKYLKSKKLNLKNARAVAPGFVDCHTHLVFAGDRALEFAARCAGATYEQIAAKGGGIVTTVNATRETSKDALFDLAVRRVQEAYAYGVRTLEIKSGYGLNIESEIKLLEVAQKLKCKFKDVKFSITFLGAHAFPKEMERGEYLQSIIHEMLPTVAKRKLADACDVFIDEGYFTVEEAKRILSRAQELGLMIKVHADELGNTESAAFAVKMGALSADHLLKISEKGVRALSQSDTVAVLLPATAFYLKAPYAPARSLIDAGACVALSTDFNPGTSMTLSLPVVMTLAALYMDMSVAEIFAAVTYNAAKALGLEDKRGTLEPGMDAAFSILPFKTFEEVYYRFAWAPEFSPAKR